MCGVAIVLGGSLVSAACRPRTAPSLTVRATDLVLTTGDGRELHSKDLLGATLSIDATAVRLDAGDRDPEATGVVLRHRFTVMGRDGQIRELCEPDPQGDRWAVPVLDERRRVQLVCSSGAIAKCVRWGYPPSPLDGAGTRRALHAACVRMVRADYGGTGETATRDGTRIRFCDRAGVHPCPGDGELEAAWAPDGATCVARPRIPELMTLDRLARRSPRLAGHLGPASCTMTAAGRAVLFSLFPSTLTLPGRTR